MGVKEISDILEIRTDTIKVILDRDEYLKVDPYSIGVNVNALHGMIIINEPGLYSLIIRSRKPVAKAFKRWVIHEVLPAIRRTGQYQLDAPLEEKLEAFMQGYQIEKQKRLDLEAEVDDIAPKAEAHDEAMDLVYSMTMRNAAKVLGIGPRSIGPLLAHP
jgi:prophage antirepressor-like protein